MKYCLLALCCLMMSACQPRMSAQQQAFLEQLANRPVTCEGARDCADKWSRAAQWVSAHSARGIRTLSDTLIQTNMVATADGPPVLKYPEFTVARYAGGAHGYTFSFTSYCEHGFACNPSGLKLRADFVTFVMGLPDGVTSPAPGVFRITTHTP